MSALRVGVVGCGHLGRYHTNLYAAIQIMSEMNAAGETGSVVTMICDDGTRYLDTYYHPEWLEENGFEITPYVQGLNRFLETGRLHRP